MQAVESALRAITHHSDVNAFVEVFEDEARRRAAYLDEQYSHGPLHGVIVGLKDNICFANHTVSAGSRMLSNFTSLYSATAVSRLIDAGAIIIGRQNCDEFGMGSTNENSFYGPVLNPENKQHVAGGSSGGSAAAVRLGMCHVSLGSDTGGSVRLPADFCGVIGYKPSYGRISRYGLIAYASSFDQIGILANHVHDIEAVLAIIAGSDEFDSTTLPDRLDFSVPGKNGPARIAYFAEWLEHPSLDSEIRSSLVGKIEQLRKEGCEVERIDFPLTDYIVAAYYILTTAEASSNLARYDGARFGYRSAKSGSDLAAFYRNNRNEGLGAEVKKRIMLGSFVLSAGYHDAYYTKAQKVRTLLQTSIKLIFSEFDYIIAPNAPSTAYKLGSVERDPLSIYLGDIFSVFANLCGLPAMSLPIFKHSSNLPFGLQVLASPQNEVPLLRFAHQLMQQ